MTEQLALYPPPPQCRTKDPVYGFYCQKPAGHLPPHYGADGTWYDDLKNDPWYIDLKRRIAEDKAKAQEALAKEKR